MSNSINMHISDYSRVMKSHLRQFTPFRKNYTEARVIIFRNYKIAYVPIPKCANSSIRAALLPLINIKPSSVSRIQEFEGFEELNLRQFLRNDFSNDWFVFCVVRNPYSRFASAYLDKLVNRHEVLRPLRRMGLKKEDSFFRYMKMLNMWPLDARNEHFAPQSRLVSKMGYLPDLSYYKFEALSTQWEIIRDEITKRSSISILKLEQRNKSKSNMDWHDLYCDESKKLADKMAVDDFKNFDYEMAL
ncbi:MAG: sulfotransferase family 2 domain-containing protein [Hyphomicrobiales bacterium]